MTIESLLSDGIDILKQGIEYYNTFAQNNPRLNNHITAPIFFV